MDSLRKSLGKRIRQLRKFRHMTQAQLAEAVGLSTDFISRVERGLCIPSLERLVPIARALSVSLAEFFLPIDPPDRSAGTDRCSDMHRLIDTLCRGDQNTIRQLTTITAFAPRKHA